jgi:hypothetical protein
MPGTELSTSTRNRAWGRDIEHCVVQDYRGDAVSLPEWVEGPPVAPPAKVLIKACVALDRGAERDFRSRYCEETVRRL